MTEASCFVRRNVWGICSNIRELWNIRVIKSVCKYGKSCTEKQKLLISSMKWKLMNWMMNDENERIKKICQLGQILRRHKMSMYNSDKRCSTRRLS